MSTPSQPPPIVEPATEQDANELRRRPRSSLSTFLFLSFMFFMMTNNGGGDDSEARGKYKTALASLEWQYSNYSTWLNGTEAANFTMVRGRGVLKYNTPC
jgi:transmembrane E3 ubiquitin-protein ligase